jgi:hypothetical protein
MQRSVQPLAQVRLMQMFESNEPEQVCFHCAMQSLKPNLMKPILVSVSV